MKRRSCTHTYSSRVVDSWLRCLTTWMAEYAMLVSLGRTRAFGSRQRVRPYFQVSNVPPKDPGVDPSAASISFCIGQVEIHREVKQRAFAFMMYVLPPPRPSRRDRFLDQAATGTAAGRGRWENGMLIEGVLTSTSGNNLGFEPGGGVLVSPTREERAANTGGVSASAAGNGTGRSGGGSGGLLPKFSPVNDTFGRKTMYWSTK